MNKMKKDTYFTGKDPAQEKREKIIGVVVLAGIGAALCGTFFGIFLPHITKEKAEKEAILQNNQAAVVELAATAQPPETTKAPTTTEPTTTAVIETQQLAIAVEPAETTTTAATTKAPVKTTKATTTTTTAPPVVTLNAPKVEDKVVDETNVDANGYPLRNGSYVGEVVKIADRTYEWKALSPNVSVWVRTDGTAKTVIMNVKSNGYKTYKNADGSYDLTRVIAPDGTVIAYDEYKQLKEDGKID